jgi:phosphotriesterase-related protein
LLFNRHQTSLAERGAFIKYDMLGMNYWYVDQHVQSPSDEDNVRAIASLIAAGYIDRLLLSQDVFLKMMPSHYGGSPMPSYFG